MFLISVEWLDEAKTRARFSLPGREEWRAEHIDALMHALAEIREAMNPPVSQEPPRLQELAREIPIATHVADYAVRLVLASHPELPEAAETARRNVRFGASPRAAQTMILASKIHAVLAGRVNVAFDDVRRVALPALRHRLILSYEAEAKGTTPDRVVAELLSAVPEQG